ncbi:hypothetical protein [Phenylobacterium sp.]|jgi:hypothetical protein|uniref:hypothetical protein n=1 Tax=Phenylobacterium sp. TaxID=1871053 RepID=UPI002F92B435
MNKTLTTLAVATLALPFAWSCATDKGPNASATTGTTTNASSSGGASAPTGSSTGASTTTGAQTGTSANTGTTTGTRPSTGGIPSLVNVNLQNVLNDLSVRLQIDRANVPVNIQLPIELAANVCGVSVNVLSVSTGGQAACSAKTAPQELAQVVQQQMAAGGSVGGGAQGGSSASTGSSTPASGTATSGASGTGGTSTGTTETTTTPR